MKPITLGNVRVADFNLAAGTSSYSDEFYTQEGVQITLAVTAASVGSKVELEVSDGSTWVCGGLTLTAPGVARSYAKGVGRLKITAGSGPFSGALHVNQLSTEPATASATAAVLAHNADAAAHGVATAALWLGVSNFVGVTRVGDYGVQVAYLDPTATTTGVAEFLAPLMQSASAFAEVSAIHHAHNGNGTGVIVWRVEQTRIRAGGTKTQEFTLYLPLTGTGNVNVIKEQVVMPGMVLPRYSPLGLVFGRIGNTAADTFDQYTALHGIKLTPYQCRDSAAQALGLPLFDSLATGNGSILCLGDSLSDGTDDWFKYLHALWRFRDPTVTTVYHPWNYTSKVFDAATTISGTGANSLHFWNGAIGGYKCANYTTGGDLAAIAPLLTVAPSVVVIALGFNESTNMTTFATDYTNLVNQVRTLFPSASILFVAQNPNLSDSYQTSRRDVVIAKAAATANSALVDVWSEFGGTSPVTDWYVSGDDKHANALGVTAYLRRIGSCLLR